MLRDERIGPSLGAELRRGALIALGLALTAQLIYLAARFRWTFGAGAVVALFANVAVVIGVFAWLGKPLDSVFLAALLTIIGYTVNDSVIVFDRIREVWRAQRQTRFPRVVSTAILATLPRTVNTGLSTVMILAALLLRGGDSLADFAVRSTATTVPWSEQWADQVCALDMAGHNKIGPWPGNPWSGADLCW